MIYSIVFSYHNNTLAIFNNGDASLSAVWGAVWSIKCKNNNNNKIEVSNDGTRKKEQRNFKWFKFSFDFFSFRNDNCVDEDCKYIGSHNVGVCIDISYTILYIFLIRFLRFDVFRCGYCWIIQRWMFALLIMAEW